MSCLDKRDEKELAKEGGNRDHLHGEPPDVGLVPTALWKCPPIPPNCNWRTLPSSQSPSHPSLSLPLPLTPLGLFAMLREGATQAGVVLRRKRVEGEGPRTRPEFGTAKRRRQGRRQQFEHGFYLCSEFTGLLKRWFWETMILPPAENRGF